MFRGFHALAVMFWLVVAGTTGADEHEPSIAPEVAVVAMELRDIHDILIDANLALEVVLAYQVQLVNYARQDPVAARAARQGVAECGRVEGLRVLCDRLVGSYDQTR